MKVKLRAMLIGAGGLGAVIIVAVVLALYSWIWRGIGPEEPDAPPPEEPPAAQEPAAQRLHAPSRSAGGNAPPAVAITAPSTPPVIVAGGHAEFQATWSDPDGIEDVARVAWDWGDQKQEREVRSEGGADTRLHAFRHPGIYTVVIRATDKGGLTAHDALQVFVSDQPIGRPPKAEMVEPAEAFITIAPGDNVHFSSRWSDPDVDLRVVFLDFGDGTPSLALNPALGRDKRDYVYRRPGTYTVTLFVSDLAGNSDYKERVVTLQGPETAPAVTISEPPPAATVPVNVSVSFTGTWSDVNQDVASVAWDFGDGSPRESAAPSMDRDSRSHVYPAPGFYTATLLVEDATGNIAHATRQINVVNGGGPPFAVFSAPEEEKLTVNEPEVRFTAQWSDPDGLGDVKSVIWDWGDSTPREQSQPGKGSDTRTHRFQGPGDHTVSVTVIDAAGRRMTITRRVIVDQRPS